MIIDLYTRCWNDAHMLGYFFRHYDPLVRRYVVYDDGSTDGSLDILRRHPRVDLRPLAYSDPESRILSAQALFEACWQESRGSADWVIVTDVDEHLHHRDLPAYLAACQAAGATIVPALGYQMLSAGFPAPDLHLASGLTRGAPWPMMSKLNLFAPDAVAEIRFAPGRHSAEPIGRIVAPARDELQLLHYKYLDFERLLARHQASAERSRPTDRRRRFGREYFWSRRKLAKSWRAVERALVDIAVPGFDPARGHAAPRWWAGCARVAVEMGGG